jgi:hypothetical protein
MQKQIILNPLQQGTWFLTVECVRNFHDRPHLSDNATCQDLRSCSNATSEGENSKIRTLYVLESRASFDQLAAHTHQTTVHLFIIAAPKSPKTSRIVTDPLIAG